MSKTVYFLLALLITAGITYLIRVLPILFFRGKIKNEFLKSFLYYVPCVVLSVLAFPAILTATGNLASGVAAAVVCALLAFRSKGLITCMMGSVAAALVVEILLTFI